jgi:hypothetical protein
MSKPCVFEMAVSDAVGGKGRKWAVAPYKAMKYNDLTSLLYALVWSCLLSFCVVWPVLAVFRLIPAYLPS